MLIAIGSGVLRRFAATELALRPIQQAGLEAVAAPLVAWAQHAPWSDPQRAAAVATIAVDTARALSALTAPGELDLPAVLPDAARVWASARHAAALYGLSLDAALASARVRTLARHGDLAHVRLSVQLAGARVTCTLAMRRLGGRWYPAALLTLARAAAGGARAPSPLH